MEITAKMSKDIILTAIVHRTGVKRVEAERALEAVLDSMKQALASGKQVDLGKELGKLKIVNRRTQYRATKNLKHVPPTVIRLHEKHPKTVRLLGGKDLSDDPQPTVILSEPEPKLAPKKKVRVAVAYPSWRRRMSQR